MKLVARSIALFLAGTASISASPVQKGPPYLLTPEEEAFIVQQVAAETMLSDRTRVTVMSAVSGADGFVHACGYVSWIDGSGLYGPNRVFSGFIGRNANGMPLFSSSIARSGRDDQVLSMVCEQYGASLARPNLPPPGAKKVQEPPPKVARMIDTARSLDGRCRGAEGADPSSTVCGERDAAFDAVNEVGWCFGKEDQFGYQHEWHACGPDSLGR